MFTVYFVALIAITVTFTIWAARPLAFGGILSGYLLPAFLAAAVADAPLIILTAYFALFRSLDGYPRFLPVSEIIYFCALISFVLWRFAWKDLKTVRKSVLFGVPILIETLLIVVTGIDEMPWDYPDPGFSFTKHAIAVATRVCIMAGAWFLAGLTYRRFAYPQHMAHSQNG